MSMPMGGGIYKLTENEWLVNTFLNQSLSETLFTRQTFTKSNHNLKKKIIKLVVLNCALIRAAKNLLYN